MPSKILKRVLLGILLTIIAVIVVVIVFISPIAKFAIEKYSVKYLGRRIKTSWVYLNPFTGHLHLHNLKIFEYQSDSIFLAAKGLSADFAIRKVLSKTYEITGLTLDNPWMGFVQNHKAFNLDDVIQRFTPKGPSDTTKGPVHFNLLNWKIINGEIHYKELSIPVNYYIREVNLESKGLRWDTDTIQANISFRSGPGDGSVNAIVNINLKTMDYRIKAVVDKFDLSVFEQYLHDLANYGSFTASLDANIKAAGNLNNQLDLDASGLLAINTFHFGKTRGEDYASFDKLVLNITEVAPKSYKYIFDSVMLARPFFKYERYDYLDNLQRMFGAGGANYNAAKADSSKFNLIIEIAKYLNALAKNFAESYYKFNKVAVYNGDFRFSDFSLREKFTIDADPLYLFTDSVDKNKERFAAHVRTGIKPYGNITIDLSADPNDYGYFDVVYKLQKLPASLFNPYVVSYTSFPLDRGSLEFTGDFHALNSVINSSNHLLILDPRTSKRVKKKDAKWIPVPLILSVVRNRGDAIDYEIPIQGDLKNPKFRIWGVIGGILTNIFVKPPSTVYLAHVKNVEKEVEKFLSLKWDMRQGELNPEQQKFITKMAKYLDESPDAIIDVTPIQYSAKEKEHIMFFEAKKRYFETTTREKSNGLDKEDSLKIDKMSVKDSAFVKYLNKEIGDTLMFTVQEKCHYLLGGAVIERKFYKLMKARADAFMFAFNQYGGNKQRNIKLHKDESEIPFDGFSYYKISYKGELPASLLKAYNEINKLNESLPRGKYEKERKKNGGVLIEEKGIR